MSFVVAAALVLLSGAGASPEGVDLAALDGWDIVISQEASPSEAYAAEQFQTFFEQAGGGQLPIVTDPERADRHVFIGASGPMAANPAGFSVEGFGDEDLRIVIRDDVIVIAGGRPRGTLYGVHTFLEDYIGVRFLTHDHTHVPSLGPWRVVGPVDRFYHPPLAFRWSFYAETNENPAFAAQNRTNTVATEAKLGEKSGLELINHTFRWMMPSQEHGEKHPEYYALVDGERYLDLEKNGMATQLCLTNPDVLRIMTEGVLGLFRANPKLKNVSVSQNDNAMYCRCPDCAALDEREGGPTGSLLTFVNAVADDVGKEFPDVLIGTLAYAYTRKPAKTVKPRPNVQIQLCSVECCILHPLDDPDCPLNVEFCQDVAAWAKLSKNVSLWHYNTNFFDYLLPCPNLRVIEPNIRYSVANNAIGVFMQAAYNGLGAEFSDLRNYVTANLLWDPNRSGEALIDEFLQLHYKAAAPPIRRFINLTHDNAARLGLHKVPFAHAIDYGIDQAIAKAGIECFEEALALADDEAVRDRVEKASICAYRAALEPIIAPGPDALANGEMIRFALPYRERFAALCKKFGVTMRAEGTPLEDFEADPLPVEAMTGKRVLSMPEQWLFKTDPEDVGAKQEWFKQTPDASWKAISILKTWDSQGHADYDGYAWYSVEVTVPQANAKAFWLLCGAVDETFELWVNGQLVGESKGDPDALWDQPVGIDITKALKPGATNRFTMRVHDRAYAGGIWKPVWLTATE